VDIESVCRHKCSLQEFSGNFESDVTQVGRRSKRRVPKFVDIEGKLSADVSVRTLAIGNFVAEFFVKFGKFDGRRGIDRFRMADRVSQISSLPDNET
jgi:hypothetical protein